MNWFSGNKLIIYVACFVNLCDESRKPFQTSKSSDLEIISWITRAGLLAVRASLPASFSQQCKCNLWSYWWNEGRLWPERRLIRCMNSVTSWCAQESQRHGRTNKIQKNHFMTMIHRIVEHWNSGFDSPDRLLCSSEDISNNPGCESWTDIASVRSALPFIIPGVPLNCRINRHIGRGSKLNPAVRPEYIFIHGQWGVQHTISISSQD
jgi:hypothetical protein